MLGGDGWNIEVDEVGDNMMYGLMSGKEIIIMSALTKSRRFHIIFFEALGSFILTYGGCSASLHVAPDIVIAASLFLAISLTGEITGGYINPLITIGTWVDKRHRKLFLYLFAQLLGAIIGAFWSWALLGPLPPVYNEGWDAKETIKFVLNELIGSAFFTVCVLMLTNRYTSLAVKSWQVYLSIPVGLFLIRKMTGNTPINPVIGIAIQLVAAIIKGDALILVRDVWPVLVPSVVGAFIGGYFMLRVYEPLLLYIKYRDLADHSPPSD